MAQAYPVYAPKTALGLVAGTLPRYGLRRAVDPSERPVDPSERPAAQDVQLPAYADSPGAGRSLPTYTSQSPLPSDPDGAGLPAYTPPPSPLPDELHAQAATEQPQAAQPQAAQPNQYQQDLARLRGMEAAPVEDTSRLRSAWTAFGAPVQPGGNLGYTLGERLAHGVSGLIDKKLGPGIQRRNEIARQQQVVAASGALDREQTQHEKDQAELAQTQANTAHVQEETKQLPRQTDATIANRQQTRLLQLLRAQGHYRRGENPNLDSQLDGAGLAVSDFDKGGKFQWKEAGGQVYTMDATTGRVNYATVGGEDGQPTPVVDASKVPNAQGLIPVQAQAAQDREADRQMRERVAAANRASRESVAAQSRAMRQDRNNLSQRNFAAKYPGYGQTVTPDGIVQKAKQLKMLPEDVLKEALRQGFTVSDQ